MSDLQSPALDDRPALPKAPASDGSEARFTGSSQGGSPWNATVVQILQPIASLKLTVALMAMSVFIVLAGTFAQVESDIWAAINTYFRINTDRAFPTTFPYINLSEFFVHIDLGMFFPLSFFPQDPVFPAGMGWLAPIWPQGAPAWLDGRGFWFPRGWTIGLVMMLNLVAAHTLRFKVQSRGAMLWGGFAAIAVGILVTTIVVFSGDDLEAVQGAAWVSYDTLWSALRFSMFLLAAPAVYGAVASPTEKSGLRFLLAAIAVLLCSLGAGSIWVGQLSDPAMRIIYQLLKGLLAALVLLVGCYMVFRKRAGIVLLHGGIGLLMAYEVLVGTEHVESHMLIFEGESSNYSFDARATELAFVDKNDPKGERHIVVDMKRLGWDRYEDGISAPRYSDERLPFDIELVEWFRNGQFTERKSGEKAVANAGAAARSNLELQRLTPATGTGDGSDSIDAPGAYIRLIDRPTGKDLGVYALWTGTDAGQTVDETPYQAALRFVRHYKPHTIYLYDIQQNNYDGTAKARDYRAIIKLTDANGNVVLDRHPIWMNNPLRYAGETYYQSSIKGMRDGNRVVDATQFQVVLNEGWMAPYVACMIVAVGMLFQFGATLLRFLNRYLRQSTVALAEDSDDADLAAESADRPATPLEKLRSRPLPAVQGTAENLAWPKPRGTAAWLVPSFCALLGLGLVAPFAMLRPKVVEDFRVGEFSQIPVVSGGRAMPIDTLARNRLMQISDRQTFKPVGAEKSLPAIVWLLDMAVRPEVADTHPVFRIENDDLAKSLEMEISENRAYALNDFKDATERLLTLAREADQIPDAQKSILQRKQIELFQRLRMYQEVKDWFFNPWEQGILAQVPELAKPDAPPSLRLTAAERLARMLGETRNEITKAQFPLLVPTQLAAGERTIAKIQNVAWESYPLAMGHFGLETLITADHSPATEKFQSLLAAWKTQQPEEFNKALTDYRMFLEETSPQEMSQGLVAASFQTVGFEEYFNRFSPFNALSWAYLSIFLTVAAAWLLAGFGKPVGAAIANRGGLWITVALFLIHTWAILGRIYLSGRPPVTNLYSSAVFIGWAMVLGGILIELVFKIGIGNLIAAIAGFATLRIAYGLVSDGDTLGVLEPVLDTTFWLSTHVVCITLGYGATYLAGLLGLVFVLYGSRLGLFSLGAMLVPVAGMLSMQDGPVAKIAAAVTGLTSLVLLGLATAMLVGKIPMQFGDSLRKVLGRIIYGTLCAATIFSFVGTVLGGLWADDSWGRFWGWDPKENGALIIVMWNALILHARWDGMIRDRGLAVLALLGNIVVSWSWFGVNQLGIGLHAYGFTEGRMFWLMTFCLSQLFIAAVGCLPQSFWWSSRRAGENSLPPVA